MEPNSVLWKNLKAKKIIIFIQASDNFCTCHDQDQRFRLHSFKLTINFLIQNKHIGL